MKKVLVAFAFLLFSLAVFFGWKTLVLYRATAPNTAALDYALQDDSLVSLPAQELNRYHAPNALKNAYWGELHIHTVESLDAVLFGTRATIEDAYRFARGETLRSAGGERMQLARPLDFVAITDHAEGFGARTRCGDEGLSLHERINCGFMQTPNAALFLVLRRLSRPPEADFLRGDDPPGVYRNRERTRSGALPICSPASGGTDRCWRDGIADWSRYKELADRYYEPGVLTTFAAYEFSPGLEGGGKHHRNVVFNGSHLPERAISSLDVGGNAIDLWRGLEETCAEECDFITIPHNMNKGWGLFYSPHTWDGRTYQPDDWRLRMRYERLAEIYQVKGASECALGVGSTDEECSFSQVLQPCEPGQKTGCAFETSFSRQGLKAGLALKRELGFNPLAFGMVAATDGHNGNPGDAEEWDFTGKLGAAASPAIRRFRNVANQPDYQAVLTSHTGGGLAAVWAEENTRDAIFAGMKRREAYATSGPRITLRFFAGWGFEQTVVDLRAPLGVVTEGGVPMGGVLTPPPGETQSPTFFVWAAADPLSAPLQRVQVVKGWIDDARATHEEVRDVICSDGFAVDPATGRCPDNRAGVELATCQITSGQGAGELMGTWKDPMFDEGEGAFYYVRVLQNPTCRWSTYDAIRLREEIDPSVPATIQERAWSSPIWIDPVSG